MQPFRVTEASLYTATGNRKYLTQAERARFIATAKACIRVELRTLCLTLAYTGCRISEALALTAGTIESGAGFIAFRSLKKRGATVIREVPVPGDLLNALESVHQLSCGRSAERLWSLSRSRAWQLVKLVMVDAKIEPGIHATPKGLRHGFGIHAIQSGVPLNLVQRWLGHARMETTAIYLQALGAEERQIAARMWDR
jgi:integrase